jgi:hypothetical protein
MGGRIFERKRRQMPCTLTLDGRNHGGLILDVSPGGLYIQSSAKIKPGDQIELQTTIPGVEGRLRLEVEVVRKVVVPAQLLKVAHGGVGVRIINAPEAYYQFMDNLGVTADAGTSKLEQLENRRAESVEVSRQEEARPEPEAKPEPKPEAKPKPKPEAKPKPKPAGKPKPKPAGKPKPKPAGKPEAEEAPPDPQLQFRVRIKQSQGPRSRTVSVEADSEDDARNQALHAAGAGWIVLGVDRADAG